jgi:hypothetical protein
MKFNGKELFELGVPQNKIKFFIGQEFTSKEELLEELKPKEIIKKEKVFTWLNWLWKNFEVSELPMRLHGDKPVPMSKSELTRIFDSGGVEINGQYHKSDAECREEDFPITSWIWFPKSIKKVTWL